MGLFDRWFRAGRDDVASSASETVRAAQDATRMLEEGMTLENQGQMDDALRCYESAIQLMPDLARAHFNRGNILLDRGDSSSALTAYSKAVELKPDSASAYCNVGHVYARLGQHENAIAAYGTAISLEPQFGDAEIALGNLLDELGNFEEAMVHYRRAIAIDPEWAEAYNNLGVVLCSVGRYEEAVECLERAIKIKPRYVSSTVNMAILHKDLGNVQKAMDCLREAIVIEPNHAHAHSDLLFIHNYSEDLPADSAFSEAQQYGRRIYQIAEPFTKWAAVTNPEHRIRVGLVSGDLRSHPVGFFLEGVLGAISGREFDDLEWYAYPTRICSDDISHRIKACCAVWCSAVGLSDEALAKRIHSDRIDILIDLAGHTAHNRLPVFAWKPAPVQVSWLGYFATTGVAAIDYLIADPLTLPPSEEVYFTEKIWRLEETRLCFTVPDAQVSVSALPAIDNGYVTFGCFNNLAKMNGAVVGLWARILHAIPSSRLFLKSIQLAEPSLRQEICGRFAAHGVDAGRLILEAYGPRADYLAAYQRVDIALDPFPFPGGTTTVESLWMGVPVLTLAGERFLSRQGFGLLMNAGLPDWIASDPDDYVARAISHASDLRRLATLRAGLRQQVLASPIFDAPRFARNFAAALRGMWQKWCEENTGAPLQTEKASDGTI